jgi:hypothetical protein
MTILKTWRLRSKDLQRIFSHSLWENVEIKERDVNGHSVVDVHLTEDMLITALTLGVRTRQSSVEDGRVATIQANERQHVIGLEGAMAVASVVYHNWLKALDYVSVRGVDSCDLTLNGRLMDVKTRTEKWHDILMVPKKQWVQRKYDFYIGCNIIAEDWVRIWGYISREQLEKNGKWDNFGHGDTLCMPFNELNNIAELKQLSA